MMDTVFEILEREEIPCFFSSFSALDRLFGKNNHPNAYIFIDSTLARISREIPDLEYPGLESADAVIPADAGAIFIRTADSVSRPEGYFTVQGLLYNRKRNRFLDPHDIYYDLRRSVLVPSGSFNRGWQCVHDAAVLVSRYHYTPPAFATGPEGNGIPPPAPDQRALLTSLVTSEKPREGFTLLMEEGYIGSLWPELFRMDGVVHGKEHHPEGNVWEHTLETFRYRKTQDLVLSLGLFLHDIGKPQSPKNEGRAFDGHAEIGAAIAEKFLRRLGYPEEIIRQVCFLILHHMIPGALDILPTARVENIMASPLFPMLLELYRCDLLSTFRGPDGYYTACTIYRSFLRNTKNPFRNPDGKKLDRKNLMRLYVE